MRFENVIKGERRRVTKGEAIPTNRTSADSLKTELDTWLVERTIWNHDDWLGLLLSLRTRGFSDLIDTQRGRDAIGLYLETNRNTGSC